MKLCTFLSPKYTVLDGLQKWLGIHAPRTRKTGKNRVFVAESKCRPKPHDGRVATIGLDGDDVDDCEEKKKKRLVMHVNQEKGWLGAKLHEA